MPLAPELVETGAFGVVWTFQLLLIGEYPVPLEVNLTPYPHNKMSVWFFAISCTLY